MMIQMMRKTDKLKMLKNNADVCSCIVNSLSTSFSIEIEVAKIEYIGQFYPYTIFQKPFSIFHENP